MIVSLLAEAGAVPYTAGWSPSVAIIMILFNIFGVFLAAKTVQNPGVGTPLALPGIAEKFSVAQLLAGTAFGHILGTGVILGLATTGVL
ncbi:photosystem I reaction center subunit PsaK [Merismopedia glauca]|uniref:Photosystem I reaction center subunit PsaK n=1 Tax=Merismopedia glauca CCAP 1448/3 TaxID=1296344 RepID=A0A2T1BZK0_9CYAN|nr:photosystem I reaction center subunit PsaK [Merismopedia glauca]PSB01455.1 photosystem I reaction center subunit PsaK [Merismopedia glauca CCAP 1448/3]